MRFRVLRGAQKEGFPGQKGVKTGQTGAEKLALFGYVVDQQGSKGVKVGASTYSKRGCFG